MKNIPELPCAIVEDLLPAYVEGLTAEETRQAVEAHLASCPACAAKRAAMGAEEGPSPEESEETAREVDYLKAVRRRSRRRAALAVLATLLVLMAGFAAMGFVIGSPLDPAGVMVTSFRAEDDLLQVRLSSTASGNAFRGWTVDNRDGVVSITARSVLASPLFRNGGGMVEIPMAGVTEIWLGQAGEGRMIWQAGTEISAGAWALYQAQTPYVGDAPAVGNLLAALDTWYGPAAVDYTISLWTHDQPYKLTLHFDGVTAHIEGAAASINERMRILSPVLLALVGNLGEVQWTYAAPDGTAVTHSMTLEEANAGLPGWVSAYNTVDARDFTAPESIKDYAASPADVQQLVSLAEFGFYTLGPSGHLTSKTWLT